MSISSNSNACIWLLWMCVRWLERCGRQQCPCSSSEKWIFQDWAKAPLNLLPHRTVDARVLTQVGDPTAKQCRTPLFSTGSASTVPKRHGPHIHPNLRGVVESKPWGTMLEGEEDLC